MATPRRQRFVYAQTAWMLGSLVVLLLLNSLSMALFFATSFVGFLVVVELTAPFDVAPRWRSRLRWVVLLGLVGLGYVLVRRVLEILPRGLF